MNRIYLVYPFEIGLEHNDKYSGGLERGKEYSTLFQNFTTKLEKRNAGEKNFKSIKL